MGSVEKLANEIRRGFSQMFPASREVLKRNLPPVIAAMMEARTANLAVLASYLPLELTRRDLREQWLSRSLSNKFLDKSYIMKPFATRALQIAAKFNQVIQLSMDQTDIGNRFAILVISVRIGARALPLVWKVEQGAANIGFEGQKELLEQVLSWIPEDARIMFAADRFYPSEELFKWLKLHHWQYRIRLKGNYLADIGRGDFMTTGTLAQGRQERYETNVSLFGSKVMTNIGIVHEPGHKEPWIIAMDCQPNRARTLDYSSRWCIEPMFSDFKSSGFCLEETHVRNTNRLDKLILVMALAMHWCVSIGREDALNNRTPVEKKASNTLGPITGPFENLTVVRYLGFKEVYVP